MKLSNNKQGIIFDKSIQKPSATFISSSGQGEFSYYNDDFHFRYSDGNIINVKDISIGIGDLASGDTGDIQINNGGSFGISSDVISNYSLGVYDGTGTNPAGFSFADYSVTGNTMEFVVDTSGDNNSFGVNIVNSVTSGALTLTPFIGRLYHTVTDATGTTGITGLSGTVTIQAYNNSIVLNSESATINNVPLTLTSISQPSSPLEGMIYLDSGDGEMYAYINSGFSQLTNQVGDAIAGSTGDIQLNNSGALGVLGDLVSGSTASLVYNDGSNNWLYIRDTAENNYLQYGLDYPAFYMNLNVSGYTGGTAEFVLDAESQSIALTINDGSNISGFTSNGSISAIQATDYVSINDVLKILPRSSDPSSPSEGMMYVNSTDHLIHFYNGTAWYTLNMTAV